MKITVHCTALLLAALPISAGPFEDTFGAGARNKALGGAGLSIAEDYTATFYNPSLLALCRGSRLSMGYDLVHTSLNNPNPAAEQLGTYQSLNLGFCLKPLNQVGIGIYSNYSLGPMEFTASTLNTQPKFIMYAGDLKAFSMMMGTGYSPFKQLSFGAAMSLSTSVNLDTDLDINLTRSPPIVAKFPAQITPIVGAIVGVTAVPMRDWKISLVYRSATYGQIDIKAAARLKPLFTTTAAATIKGLLSYSPHQIALGSSYLLKENWLLTADATYYFWSNYPGPFLEINAPENSVTGRIKIAGIEAPNFSDVIVPRAGLEYAVWEKLKLRAGYSFRTTPAPFPAQKAQLLDANTHRISLGAGYEFQLYQNVFVIADAFLSADILQGGRGSVINTGLLVGAEYD